MPAPKITAEIITAAIEGFESQKRRIDSQIAELRAMLPGGHTETAVTPESPGGIRHKMSAAARKRMSEGQRKRWAESKGHAESPSTVPANPKRKLSAAGRANIVAALKKRWRDKRAAAKRTAPAVAKKAAVKKSSAKRTAKMPGENSQKTRVAKASEQTAPAAQ